MNGVTRMTASMRGRVTCLGAVCLSLGLLQACTGDAGGGLAQGAGGRNAGAGGSTGAGGSSVGAGGTAGASTGAGGHGAGAGGGAGSLVVGGAGGLMMARDAGAIDTGRDGAAGANGSDGGAGIGGASLCVPGRYLICEDFEATGVGAVPAGWTQHGNAAVSADQAARGAHSLKIQAAANGERRIYADAAKLG